MSQKACLRLVSRGRTSKEIALETGLTPQTVDTYLKTAMSKLGAASRREAARCLEKYELSQELGSQPPGLVTNGFVKQSHNTAEAVVGNLWWRPPPLGGSLNTLSGSQRTFAVLRIAAISLAAVLALTLVIAGVLQTFRP